MRNYLDEFIRELKNRNYAKNTIRTYSGHLKHFLTFSRKSMHEPEKRIAVFLEKEKSSPEQRRLAWAAIKLFYEIVLKRGCPYKLDRVRNRKRLPDILTKLKIKDLDFTNLALKIRNSKGHKDRFTLFSGKTDLPHTQASFCNPSGGGRR